MGAYAVAVCDVGRWTHNNFAQANALRMEKLYDWLVHDTQDKCVKIPLLLRVKDGLWHYTTESKPRSLLSWIILLP